MENWNSVNIINYEVLNKLVKQGKRISGMDVTELYNSVFNKTLKPTNCSSCINQRYKEISKSYDNFTKLLREQEEKAKALEVLDELMTPTPEELEENNPKKKGRPKKN